MLKKFARFLHGRFNNGARALAALVDVGQEGEIDAVGCKTRVQVQFWILVEYVLKNGFGDVFEPLFIFHDFLVGERQFAATLSRVGQGRWSIGVS